MRLIFFGPPGSGKGTRATRLCAKFGMKHISTGDILRDAIKNKTELGKKVESYLSSGRLAPEEIVIMLVEEQIKNMKKGFILDGFPRTIHQAEWLEKKEKIDAVINFLVKEELIIQRLATRRTCKNCAAVYNTVTLKPKVEGICDKCGGNLIQRDDEKPDVVKARFKIYQEQTKPLIEFYKKRNLLHDMDVSDINAPPEKEVERIIKLLDSLGIRGD